MSASEHTLHDIPDKQFAFVEGSGRGLKLKTLKTHTHIDILHKVEENPEPS